MLGKGNSLAGWLETDGITFKERLAVFSVISCPKASAARSVNGARLTRTYLPFFLIKISKPFPNNCFWLEGRETSFGSFGFRIGMRVVIILGTIMGFVIGTVLVKVIVLCTVL